MLDRVRQQCAALGESRRREIVRLRAELARAQLLSMLLWCMQGHSRQIVKCVVDYIKRRPVRLA